MERWKKSNQNLPEVDKQDINRESPYMSSDLRVTLNIDEKRQHHPEFTQASYLRLRSLEEAFSIHNYLDQSQNPLQLASKSTPVPPSHLITQYDRSYGIQKIFDLHLKKEYKTETLF